MAYTKAEAIEQVYLHITGGQPTEDFNVQREDIAAYIGNVFNTVALIDSRRRRQEAKQEGVGSTGVDPAFLSTEFLTVAYDADQGMKYAEFIKKVLLMDNAYGIAEVGAKKFNEEKGDMAFVKIKGRYDGVGLDYLFTEVVRWYYDNVSGKQRIYFKGISPVVEEVRVSYVIAFDDLAMDDLVPLPSGLETEVIDRTVAFFQAEADKQVDNTNNSNDDRRNAQRQQ